MDIAAAKVRCEEATARLAYWESQWRASAGDAEKEAWYDAVVRDLHDATAGFASAVEALAEAGAKALPDPDKLRLLADWFDKDDAAKGRAGPTLATLGGQPWDEVQRSLRRWADSIAATEEEGNDG